MHTNYTKVPSATIVHSFIEQVLLEYVLCARHYSRLWEFDVGKKNVCPTLSIVQSGLVGERTISQIFIANYKC